MEQALVIIDMQPSAFKAAKGISLKNNIVKEIRKAKRNKNTIILVKYRNLGNISKKLINEVGKYKKSKIITKFYDSAAPEILEIFKGNKFKLAGVNTDCCVLSTAISLLEKEKEVEIIENCCYASSKEDHIWGINQFNKKKQNYLKNKEDYET
jgi:nicotinamidase-related amidase